MRVAIHQLHYLPWLRYFHKILRADTFVLLDNIQYNKNGWQNRNRIKTAQGARILTVPVHTHYQARLDEVLIDNSQPWQKKHWQTIQQAYGKAPYFARYAEGLGAFYARPWERLNDLNAAMLRFFLEALDITTPVVFSSALDVPGEATMRLVNLIRAVGGTRYYSGAYALDAYLDQSELDAANIGLELQEWQAPVYLQLYGEPIADLSIVDLLFNVGPEANEILDQSGP